MIAEERCVWCVIPQRVPPPSESSRPTQSAAPWGQRRSNEASVGGPGKERRESNALACSWLEKAVIDILVCLQL